MPYEEVYFQRLKEENPEEYQKVTVNKTKSVGAYAECFGMPLA